MADEIEKPPVFRRWRGWYALVIGTLAAVIVALYWFSSAFS